MNVKYSVKLLCAIMGVNRSSYYKWLGQISEPNRYEQNRVILTQLLWAEHKKHKAWGYHRLAMGIRTTVDWSFSDNLAHQCCKAAGIHSKARKYRYRKPGTEHVKYENLVHGCWNATEPMQIVVSDMTCFFHRGKRYEWTLFLDTYNNEIISHSVSTQLGDNKPYYHCLDGLLRKMGKRSPPVILHTDQGAVYASAAFAQAHRQYNIVRSMSRAGTPTDNPIIEALNGWMKQELFLDFNLRDTHDVRKTLSNYVHFFNHHRPAYALNYETPVQFKTARGLVG